MKVLFLVMCFLLVNGTVMAVSIPYISGYALYSNSYNAYAPGTSVVACTQESIGYGCIGTITDYNGHYSFSNWGVPDDATVYIFAWIDNAAGGRTGTWGSSVVAHTWSPACQWRNQFGQCQNFGMSANLVLNPSPLQPTAVNPAPWSTNVPTNLTLKWTSGSDSFRQYTTIVYDIWGSGYGAPMILQTSDLPCNADASGNCQWTLPITLYPNTPFNWKIVARAFHPYHVFPTESIDYHFTTGNQ